MFFVKECGELSDYDAVYERLFGSVGFGYAVMRVRWVRIEDGRLWRWNGYVSGTSWTGGSGRVRADELNRTWGTS